MEEQEMTLEAIVSRAINAAPTEENLELFMEQIQDWHLDQRIKEDADDFFAAEDFNHLLPETE